MSRLVIPRQFSARSRIARASRQAQGLGHAWPLAEGGGAVAFDLTGKANGQIVGAPVSVPGPRGPILALDGSGQYVAMPGVTFAPGTGDFTVSLWMSSTFAGGLTTAFASSDGATDQIWLGFYYGYIGLLISGSVSLGASGSANGTLWHVVAMRRAGSIYVYRNGAIIIGPVSRPAAITVADYRIGSDSVLYFTGAVGDVRLFPRALSVAEMLALAADPLELIRPPRLHLAAPVSVSVTVTPGPGTLVLAGAAPAVSAGATLAPGPGALVLSGAAPAVSAGAAVTPGPGALALSGAAPAVSAGAAVTPGPGALALAGAAPSVSAGATVTPGPGTLALVGAAPVVVVTGSVDVVLTLGPGVLSLSGAAPVAFAFSPPTMPLREGVLAAIAARLAARVTGAHVVRALRAEPDTDTAALPLLAVSADAWVADQDSIPGQTGYSIDILVQGWARGATDAAARAALAALLEQVRAALDGWQPDAPQLGALLPQDRGVTLYASADASKPAGEIAARFGLSASAPTGIPYLQ